MKEEIINAIYLTLENANGLYEEAEILIENKKFGRAYTLYHLAFEECGRFHLLYNFYMDYVTGEKQLKDLNYGNLKKNGYERHDIKISKSFDAIFMISGIILHIEHLDIPKNERAKIIEAPINELLEELKNWRSQELELNRLKNVGLYVTFNDNKFHLPDKTITVAQYIKIKKVAKLSLQVAQYVIDFFEAKDGFFNLREVYLDELKKR